MLGCIQPMSSPMMNRMLGFCCAATWVIGSSTTAVSTAIAISIIRRPGFMMLSPPCRASAEPTKAYEPVAWVGLRPARGPTAALGYPQATPRSNTQLRRSGRLRRALGPRREAFDRQLGPFLHHVLGVAPLPLRGRRDVAATDAAVDARHQDFAGHGVGKLDLGLRPAHERIRAGRALLDRAQQPSLRDHHRDGPEARRGRGKVS